ncbi:pseudouridine synthase [Flavobacterium sp.]
MLKDFFHSFQSNISEIQIPEKFTFPFYYEPHELSIFAAKELQNYLENQQDFEHNFGLNENQTGFEIGKMFGVLVVQKSNGELGFLCAFSGKLAESNNLNYFVPTVFDMLDQNGFFIAGMKELTAINTQVEALENNLEFIQLTQQLQKETILTSAKLEEQKFKMIEAKKARKLKRIKAQEESIDSASLENIMNGFVRESLKDKFLLRELSQYLESSISEIKNKLKKFTPVLENLKEERKQKSAELQQKLFAEYAFHNQYNQLKSLGTIFKENPPAGAGECAAPKLLQYAFQQQLKPIAMAEFWWGKSPRSEIKKHKQFYPACTGKCEPILKHMLQDIIMDENPFAKNRSDGKELEIIFEDKYLLVVNKPAEFLSVAGKLVQDSVQERIKINHQNALIVHRLDMSTSGLLLIAKCIEIYKQIQYQFIKRTVKKRYVALLDGIVEENEGEINLPLRLDLDNRPFQIVCFEYGKQSKTLWKVIERKDGKTLVHFYPISGRTHQLRVHAAHALGLNAPIVGDDLYGTKSNRLHLHAEQITFEHPVTNERMTVEKEHEF